MPISSRLFIHKIGPCALISLVALPAMLIASSAFGAESVCFGGTGRGRIENGVALPQSGANFSAYSHFASILDRNYVHSKVADVVIEAYAAVAKAQKELVFVYGESGHEKGGPFPPHRTHQNGLSVDFMVPIRDKTGKPASLPTNPLNRYGYDLEFDRQGRMRDYRIDFEAMALHLEALDRSARKHGIGIERVIFDPAYLPMLLATSKGAYLQSQMSFMRRQAWVRHDEHYHVDFALPCRPLH